MTEFRFTTSINLKLIVGRQEFISHQLPKLAKPDPEFSGGFGRRHQGFNLLLQFSETAEIDPRAIHRNAVDASEPSQRNSRYSSRVLATITQPCVSLRSLSR